MKIMIFKQGKINEVDNCRPVKIICNFSKIFQNLFCNVLFYGLKPSICNVQDGFYNRRSAVSNIICSTQYTATHSIQYDINKVQHWFGLNALSLNISKCNTLSFSTKFNPTKFDQCCHARS